MYVTLMIFDCYLQKYKSPTDLRLHLRRNFDCGIEKRLFVTCKNCQKTTLQTEYFSKKKCYCVEEQSWKIFLFCRRLVNRFNNRVLKNRMFWIFCSKLKDYLESLSCEIFSCLKRDTS